jgi:hypothetical protein
MRTPIQAITTKTTVFDGAAVPIDNSKFQAGCAWLIALKISSMTADAQVRFQFSYSSDNFATQIVAFATFALSGATSPSADRRMTITPQDYPGVPVGTPAVAVRLSIKSITGTSPSVTYESWIEA